MRNIVSLYIDKYNIRDNESEEKRIRGLIKKLHEKKSIFCDFPFDYMMENEQLELLHYIMTTLPERQIMANMKKVDADRCYMNFVYRSDESKTVTKNILENVLEDYNPISLSNEILNSRYIIRDPRNSIDEIDELIEKQLGRRKMEWTDQKENGHNDLDAETVSECFSAYVTHRSKFYEEYGIKEVLKDEMLNSPSLFEKVPIEYKAEKRIVSEDEFKSIKDTITEGKTIDIKKR